MNRRTFVVLLGTVTGCSALPSPDGSGEASMGTQTATSRPDATTATETPTAAPTETATRTATEEPPPTETETPTPTAAEERGAAALDRAEQALTDIVETFTAEYGSELTAVDATSVEFLSLDYELQLAFADAQGAYTDARQVAANAEQEQRAAWMSDCWQFLQGARKTQTEVVQGYVRLDRAREAFEAAEPDPARTAIDELATRRRRASTRYEQLQAESTAEAASVIGPISVEEYQNKLAQLDADIDIYHELNGTLDEFAEGIKWFKLAEIEFDEENRNVQDAENKAETAEDILYDVTSDLRSIIKAADDNTTLVPMVKELRAVALDKAETASEMDN
jgi:hypothetical protein